MYIRKNPISRESLPETFAEFFNDKIVSLSGSVVISDGVYNGVKNHRPDAEHFKRLRSLFAKQHAGRPSNYSFNA